MADALGLPDDVPCLQTLPYRAFLLIEHHELRIGHEMLRDRTNLVDRWADAYHRGMDLPEAHRTKVLARALELVKPDFVQWSNKVCLTADVVCAPSAEAIAVVPTAGGVVVTVLTQFRYSYWPQSGSDWGEHEIRVYDLNVVLDGVIVAERLVHQRGFHIHEVDEDDYDDAKAAKSVADEVIAKMP